MDIEHVFGSKCHSIGWNGKESTFHVKTRNRNEFLVLYSIISMLVFTPHVVNSSGLSVIRHQWSVAIHIPKKQKAACFWYWCSVYVSHSLYDTHILSEYCWKVNERDSDLVSYVCIATLFLIVLAIVSQLKRVPKQRYVLVRFIFRYFYMKSDRRVRAIVIHLIEVIFVSRFRSCLLLLQKI